MEREDPGVIEKIGENGEIGGFGGGSFFREGAKSGKRI
jgi:hypothetical protein